MNKKIQKTIAFLLVLCTYGIGLAQQITVTGVVTSAADQSLLPTVNVLVKGKNRGVLTDFDGNYTIKVAPTDVLEFSYIGFETKSIAVEGKNEINVSLQIGVDQLEEVVVTGYDTSSKRTFTGASSSIKASDLKIDGVVDVGRMLEGKAAGVNLQNVTGTFGAAPKITIRGASSVFGDTRPLWVIDGVIQEDIVNTSFEDLVSGDASTLISSSIAGLNANDIEKIDILKDASATSLYGARALNGVVVITTKNGRKDSPLKITYNLEQTIRDTPSYANYDILNSRETFSVFGELESKGYLQLPNVAQGRYGGVYTILAREINRFGTSNGQFGVPNTVEGRNQFLQQYELANTDWFKELFRQSVTQNHTLSFSGGGKSNTFYASIGYYHDPGWTIADKIDRITSNLKNTFYFSDEFNLTISTLASVREQNAPGTFRRETDQFRGSSGRNFDINPFNYALSTNRTLRPRDDNGNLEFYRNNWAPFNIFDELENNYIELDVKDVRFQIEGKWDISDKFNYNFLGSARYVVTNSNHNMTENSNVANAYRAEETTIVRDDNIFLFDDPNDPTRPPYSVLPEGGIFRKTVNNLTNYYLRNSLSYKDVFNEKHELDVLFGQELRYIDRNEDFFIGYGLQYERGLIPFTDPDIFAKTLGELSDYFGVEEERERTVGLFSKTTYTFNRKYTLSLTGRYDGSNRQGRSNSSRWLPTGSVSAKWDILQEKFMQNVETISGFSLRASYGLTATAGPATNSLAIFRNDVTNRLNFSARERFLNIEDLQNNELTWEKQFETNIGLDLNLLENRIQLSTDIYKRNGFDLVDFVRSSGVGGESVKQGNNADLETKGIEVSLTVTPIKTDNFKWSSTLNLSALKQEITALKNRPQVQELISATGGNIVGFPRGALFSFDFIGLDSRGLPRFVLPDDPNNPNNAVTGADFQDIENITDYLKFEGAVEPTKTAGFSNTFSYKNWAFSFLISASGGNKIRLDNAYPVTLNGNSLTFDDRNVYRREIINRWVVPGDENITSVPVIPSSRLVNDVPDLFRAYNAYNNSDIRVADGDFVRMKNVTLRYRFPEDLLENIGFNSFSMQLSATNPFLIYSDSKLNGQDPEFFRSGGVSYPIARQFTLTLNLGL